MKSQIIKKIERDVIENAIERMIKKIVANHQKTERLFVVGIANGGIPLGQLIAKKLDDKLKAHVEYGTVNILFHRDDLKTKPIPKIAFPANLLFSIEDEKILLVDDVLFSGRTVRAAINDLFDQGRPERIELAILFDRGNRRLPFQADYVGFQETVPLTQNVIVMIDNNNPKENHLMITSK